MSPEQPRFDRELRRLFGPQARSEGPLAASGAGRRLLGVDPVNTVAIRRRLADQAVERAGYVF